MLDSVVFHLDIAVTVRLLFKKIAADCFECYTNDMAKRLYSSAFFFDVDVRWRLWKPDRSTLRISDGVTPENR